MPACHHLGWSYRHHSSSSQMTTKTGHLNPCANSARTRGALCPQIANSEAHSVWFPHFLKIWSLNNWTQYHKKVNSEYWNWKRPQHCYSYWKVSKKGEETLFHSLFVDVHRCNPTVHHKNTAWNIYKYYYYYFKKIIISLFYLFGTHSIDFSDLGQL